MPIPLIFIVGGAIVAGLAALSVTSSNDNRRSTSNEGDGEYHGPDTDPPCGNWECNYGGHDQSKHHDHHD